MATYSELVVNVADGSDGIVASATLYTVPAGRRAEVSFFAFTAGSGNSVSISNTDIGIPVGASSYFFEKFDLKAGGSIGIIRGAGTVNYTFTAVEYTTS